MQHGAVKTMMDRLGARAAAAALALAAPFPALGQEAAPAPALDGIFAAFEDHPLVGIGDRHGLAEGHVFYEALIRDPRFARDVGNVVVEFGGAARQDTIDRFVNGEDVPYAELRRVWTDTVGWIPTVESLYFAHFFYQVRATNRDLPEDLRIKVWLGEPPVDWSQIESQDAWRAIADTRDAHAAQIITDHILTEGEKALVIYGSQHFAPYDAAENDILARWAEIDPDTVAALPRNLQKRVEDTHPGVFFVAQIYIGFADRACTAVFERRMSDWTLPVLAARDKDLEQAARECLPEPEAPDNLPPGLPDFVRDYMQSRRETPVLLEGDAILFVGRSAGLTVSPRLPDIFLDMDYRREIERRLRLMIGQELPADYGRNLPASMAWTQRD